MNRMLNRTVGSCSLSQPRGSGFESSPAHPKKKKQPSKQESDMPQIHKWKGHMWYKKSKVELNRVANMNVK